VIAPQFPSYPWLKPSDNKSKLDTRGQHAKLRPVGLGFSRHCFRGIAT